MSKMKGIMDVLLDVAVVPILLLVIYGMEYYYIGS